MGVVWQAGKEKREDQTRNEKREGQTATQAPVALAGLRLTEMGVKQPKEAGTGARRPKKAATGVRRPGEAATVGAKGLASLSSPAFLLLPAFLLSSVSLAFRQAFFWLLINASGAFSPFLVFYSFPEDLLLCLHCP